MDKELTDKLILSAELSEKRKDLGEIVDLLSKAHYLATSDEMATKLLEVMVVAMKEKELVEEQTVINQTPAEIAKAHGWYKEFEVAERIYLAAQKESLAAKLDRRMADVWAWAVLKASEAADSSSFRKFWGFAKKKEKDQGKLNDALTYMKFRHKLMECRDVQSSAA